MMQGYAHASQNGVDILLLDWSGLVLWPLESTYYQWELGFSVLEQYLRKMELVYYLLAFGSFAKTWFVTLQILTQLSSPCMPYIEDGDSVIKQATAEMDQVVKNRKA